jgi:hypothetical protein
LILKHAYDLAYNRDRNRMLVLLRTETFGAPYSRFEACVLRALAGFLPLRVIAALKLKPAAFVRGMRDNPGLAAIFPVVDALSGRTVVRRTVTARSTFLGPVEAANDTGR